MRANAPQLALLAFTGIVLLPVSLLAHTHPVRPAKKLVPASHRSAATPHTHHSPKQAAHAVRVLREAAHKHGDSPHLHRSHGVAKSRSNPAAARVHAFVRAQQKATPADFVKAADNASGKVAEASAEDKEIGQSSPLVSDSEQTTPAEASDSMSVVIKPAEKAVLARASGGDAILLRALYKHGRLVVPPPLKGSHEILIHQNLMADSDGLDRIRDDDDLDRMRKAGLLVALPVNSGMHVDERLPVNRRYCRPWTALFLDVLARQYSARFQTPLQVNSAVRTVEFQQRLIHTNGNAAPAAGDTASPHLTGQAVDIAKHGLSLAEIAWLRAYLMPLVQAGKVDVEEEFQQSCFHISVYKKYMPAAPTPRRLIATGRGANIGVLATAMR
jgi:hypothetical protein